MEMLDKIIYKFIGWIDGLNQKINDVLTMDFTNFSKKELLNTMGGWIITHKKQYFCHDGKDGSCFDLYCNIKLEQQQENDNARTLWKSKR